MDAKAFHVGDILSVTTGRLMREGGMRGIYEVCQHMLGYPVWTHQLPRACREITPHILEQHPALTAFDGATISRKNVDERLKQAVASYGETLFLTPLPPGAIVQVDPITEAAEMMGERP